MKIAVLFLFIALSGTALSQLVDGPIVTDKRQLTSTIGFKLIDNNEGVLFYELSVDRTGKVTSATLVKEGTTVISTPTKIKVRNHLMQFKFEAGTHYPEFHKVKVKVTTAKQ
ncbi:MAG: hypothetical protein E6Q38_00845 [Crocinitomicaceae bacterium]|nr:MAG: hypothetical protein E6Q38_00845 [Crocinitomicaceae bacterium]